MTCSTETRPISDVVALQYGVLAVVIVAGGIPRRYRSLTIAEIDRIARAGIARLGLAEAHRIDAVTSRLNLQMLDATRETPDADVSSYKAEIRRLWGSLRNYAAGTDLAWAHWMERRRLAAHDYSAPPLDTETFLTGHLDCEATHL